MEKDLEKRISELEKTLSWLFVWVQIITSFIIGAVSAFLFIAFTK